jgi:hypothetical protein
MRFSRTLILFIGLSFVLVMAPLPRSRHHTRPKPQLVNAPDQTAEKLIKPNNQANPPPNLLRNGRSCSCCSSKSELSFAGAVPVPASQLIVRAIVTA